MSGQFEKYYHVYWCHKLCDRQNVKFFDGEGDLTKSNLSEQNFIPPPRYFEVHEFGVCLDRMFCDEVIGSNHEAGSIYLNFEVGNTTYFYAPITTMLTCRPPGVVQFAANREMVALHTELPDETSIEIYPNQYFSMSLSFERNFKFLATAFMKGIEERRELPLKGE